MSTKHLLSIIGSGPAGLTAAIYAARAQLNPIVFAGNNPGGQLMETSMVENWPGIVSVAGPKLMISMREHAEKVGARIIDETVTKINLSASPFAIFTGSREYQASAVIVATGATPRRLQCPGEQEYWGKGVSTCSVCDATFYRDKRVVVVGGGDTAMEHAATLAKFTNNVTVVHLRDKLSASAVMQERVLGNAHITVRYQMTVAAIMGDGQRVTGVTLVDTVTGAEEVLPVDGVFLGVGLKPNSELFVGQLELDRAGYILPKLHTQTSVPGVFVAGDVADSRYRQAITAAGEGCQAALDAERFLAAQK